LNIMNKIKKYLPTPMMLLAFLLSFATIYAVGSPILQDNDIGWHIAAGDLIRTQGSLPKFDPWSFTGGDQVWYNLSWLWDVVLSFINDKTGIEGLFIFAILCPSLAVTLLLASLRKRYAIGNNALIFMGMITTYCMLEFANARPQIVGMFFALAFHHILHINRPSIASKKSVKLLFILPLLIVLWVNIHGSFFVSFIILGAFGLESIYYRQYKWLARLLAVSAVCVLALLVNPYGIHVIDAVLRTTNSVIAKYIMEWQPFVFGNILGASAWILAFICLSNFKGSNATIADKILAIMWLVATFFSIRNMGFMAILGAPYLASNLPADNQQDKNTKKLAAWINNIKFSPAIMAVIILAIPISYILLPFLGSEHYKYKVEESPVPAIDFIRQNYSGKRILNDYDLGGKIIYESKGKLPVFIDGRAGTAYSEKLLTDFLGFFNLDKDWQQIIEPYNIDVIMVANYSNFSKAYERGSYHDYWQQVYHDKIISIYTKKD